MDSISKTDSSRPKYHCFISYAHADFEQARKLQRGLQRIARPWYGRPTFFAFRDDTHLAAESDLTDALRTALRASKYLVLLASAESRRSEWVDREVAFWLEGNDHVKNDPAAHVIIILCDGELRWDQHAGDFVWNDQTPLPPSLRGAFSSEQKFVDYSKLPIDQWSLRRATFNDGIASIVARILRIPKEDIGGEDLKQIRRARRLATAAAMLIGILAVLAATFGFRERAAHAETEVALRRTEDKNRFLVLERAKSERMIRYLTQREFELGGESTTTNRDVTRDNLDRTIQQLEEDIRSQAVDLPPTKLLKGALEARMALVGDDDEKFNELNQRLQEVDVIVARAYLHDNDEFLLELDTFDKRELERKRKSLLDLERLATSRVPRTALGYALGYLNADAIKHASSLDINVPEEKTEAVRILKHCLQLFELAATEQLLSKDQELLARDLRNELFELGVE